MSKQKWSGVKLTKKEQEEVKKEERIELVAEIMTFIFIIAIAAAIIAVMMAITRYAQ